MTMHRTTGVGVLGVASLRASAAGLAVGLATGFAAVLGACGSGGSSGTSSAEKPYVAALEKNMVASDSGSFSLSSKQASCMAPKWIHTIGVDRLKAKGVTPEVMADSSSDSDFTTLDLSESEGNTLYDTFGTCGVDVKALFIDSLNPDMSDDDTACVKKSFSDDLLKKVLVAELIKGDAGLNADPTLKTDIKAALGACPGAVPS
jgi:hypothetical protein